MSTSSNASYASLARRNLLARRSRPSRAGSSRVADISTYDAYTFALRAAYLWHLLQPKARRLQHGPAPRPQATRQNTNVTQLLQDSFVMPRDPKALRFPSSFMAELDKRLTGVLVGKEKMAEYSDASVKRTFAVFLNEFKDPKFRKSADKDRKMEDLLLIFFSNATKELSKSKKSPEDDSYKLMVDRHVALFVRLVGAILRDNDWARDKPELMNRLETLEGKLLRHEQDLAANHQRNGGAGGVTTEVEVPRSSQVKDMPMVMTVVAVFGKQVSQAQADIEDQKDLWTEDAALQDLKTYQTSLSLSRGQTLRKDDFQSTTAYESWRKAESQELSQMIISVIQAKPSLANRRNSGSLHTRAVSSGNGLGQSRRSEDSRQPGSPIDGKNFDFADVPGSPVADDLESFMFFPPDAKLYYRRVLKEILSHEIAQEVSQEKSANGDATHMLSKDSLSLLAELGSRWRVPISSRIVALKDIVREMLVEQTVSLDVIDAIFLFLKEPELDNRKTTPAQQLDMSQWPIADVRENQQIIATMYDTLMRDLFSQLLKCFEAKPPDIGLLMVILETHLYEDPTLVRNEDSLASFTRNLEAALLEKAGEEYENIRRQNIPQDEDVEFFHVMQLGKTVLKQAERIQKRYRKAPRIMGVAPAKIFIKVILPAFGNDAKEIITYALGRAQQKGEEIPIDDGFECYREMVEMRQIHHDVLPDLEFAFHVEESLAPFVWRWINATEEKVLVWVEAAIRQDLFQVQAQDEEIAEEDQRHSVSVVDVFRSFNEIVDQIINLNWGDEVQFAKFMTTLSKSIGAGLTRYCEQIERYFIAEMDRIPPEQEPIPNQSRQEKWMQMARDAISTKEKMEPFQFLTELNNIEFAMLQLDALEKKMKVDACADILQRNEPLQARQRKPEKFVFTIKIIEAEDLKAFDMNGLSDPYVVLGDEFQKRLAKTRVIYASLNPRWEETVDITTAGPLSIIATLWDWDIMGEHGCIGRTFIKLDPSHFRDFLPREYWLDLDTQGRLLVRVSMEGEKDDIRFHFGKAFRTLKRTEREMTRKITDKLSAYIQYCLSKRTLRNLTTKGISMSSISSISSVSSSVSNYFAQRMRPQIPGPRATDQEVEGALKPLFAYFNDNFAIMNQTLTKNSMISVMTRLWKETLSTIESLLVPPLSDKLSTQKQLSEQEMEIIFKWLQLLFDFFHAVDDESKEANGVPLEILKSPKYHDLKNLNFFYYEPTDALIRTSERMAVETMNRQRETQVQAPTRGLPSGIGKPQSPIGGLMSLPTTRRSKTVMHKRNLGTIRKAKEEKRRDAQAEPSDDMILRILRMRPEAERYLRDRSRQKERLAAAAAAELIVRQSMAQGAAREREIRREMAAAERRTQV